MSLGLPLLLGRSPESGTHDSRAASNGRLSRKVEQGIFYAYGKRKRGEK